MYPVLPSTKALHGCGREESTEHKKKLPPSANSSYTTTCSDRSYALEKNQLLLLTMHSHPTAAIHSGLKKQHNRMKDVRSICNSGPE